jgi:hypothetical protein
LAFLQVFAYFLLQACRGVLLAAKTVKALKIIKAAAQACRVHIRQARLYGIAGI